jgi:hypothetical protein
VKNITTKVHSFPVCDMCKKEQAHYDGKTILGPWAHMCEYCFKMWSTGLGIGKGQRLELYDKDDNQ